MHRMTLFCSDASLLVEAILLHGILVVNVVLNSEHYQLRRTEMMMRIKYIASKIKGGISKITI